MKNKNILIGLIVILSIALIIMTTLYFNMKKNAEENMKSALNAANEVYELNQKINQLEEQLNKIN